MKEKILKYLHPLDSLHFCILQMALIVKGYWYKVATKHFSCPLPYLSPHHHVMPSLSFHQSMITIASHFISRACQCFNFCVYLCVILFRIAFFCVWFCLNLHIVICFVVGVLSCMLGEKICLYVTLSIEWWQKQAWQFCTNLVCYRFWQKNMWDV
jgi:hypothetical protein